MGFFSSLKRNVAVTNAEMEFKDIAGEVNVIRSSIERGRPVTKDYVLKIIDRAKKAHCILHDEYKREMDNNTFYNSMYPDLSFEISQLEKYLKELDEIIEKHYSENK